MIMACASKIAADVCLYIYICGAGMQDKATVERFKNQSSGRRREHFPACSVVGPGGTNPFSVGFAVAIHVADV